MATVCIARENVIFLYISFLTIVIDAGMQTRVETSIIKKVFNESELVVGGRLRVMPNEAEALVHLINT